MLGQDFALEQGPPGVVRAELVLGYPVDRGPLGTPAAGEDAGAADHAVGVDPVDPDAMLAELGGEQAHLVRLVGLGGAVGHVVRPGEHRVLAAHVHDVAAHPLGHHDPGRLAGDQEGASRHHVVLHVPVGRGGFEQRPGDGQSGVVDHEIHAAEGQGRDPERLGHAGLVGHIRGDAHGGIRGADARGHLAGRVAVPVGDHHAGSLGGQPPRGRPPDP